MFQAANRSGQLHVSKSIIAESAAGLPPQAGGCRAGRPAGRNIRAAKRGRMILGESRMPACLQ
jgi:hypothetical protein